ITERSGYVIQLDITEELLSRSGCLIPDFHLTMGDSIWCDIYMRNPNHTAVELRYNFTQSSLLFSTESDEHVLFSCDRIGTPFFFSGMVLNLYPYESLKVDVCGRNESSGSWKFYPAELMDNFFEHEFRQLIELSQLTIEVPKEFQVDSVELEVTYRKDFIDTDTIVEGLDVYFDGFVYRVDSSELKKLEFDEGFYTDIRPFIKLKDCSAGPSGEDLEAKLELSVRGVNGFEFAVIPITSTPWKEFDFASTRDIEIDYPEIELEFGPPTISANTEEFCRSIRWQQSEKVEYLTISTELFKEDGAKIVVTESGGLELEEVIQGRFVADNVERGVYFFDVCVESDTCVDDSLFVDLSWSCVSDTNAIETCYDSAFVFEIKKENAELELDIQSESQVELCDTSEYIYISVINGDLGRAYDNRLYVILPMGFSFLPDDIEVQYPTGSQWRSLGLPKLFSGNIFYWELDNVITSADGGLPGLDSVPDNKINIRMKLLSSCDLATGRVVTYWTEGSNPCGSMTNTVRKSTRPFRVEGLDQRFQSVIDLDLDRDNCGGSVLMRFEMTTNQMTMGGELVEIVIPGSLMYDSLSMVGIQNVLSHEPDILDFGGMRILTFFLDRAIDASEKVIFEITLSGIESVNCGDHVITGSVKSVAEAICVATSMPCETFVENGSDDIVLTKQGVDISIDSTLVFDSLDSKFLKSFLNFPEIDDTTGLQYSLTIFRDNELTGVLDTMDVILLDTNIVANVENGSSFNCFDLGPDPGCDWLMIIEGGCVCTPDTISLQHTDIQEFSYCDTICQGDSIWIGRPLSSNTVFQWRSDHELCDTCDQQWVKPDNGTDSIRMFVYEQRISSAESCEESHRYKVVVVPTPPYFQDTILACPGNTVLLATRKPADWTGEGIDQSNKRSIEVNRAGKYQAVYYDEYGCLVYHDFLVDYFVLSNYEIIMDTTIAPGDSIQLWIDPVPDSVIWHPKDGLSCTSCPAPWASPDTTTTYRATVIDDNGCLIELELTLRTAFPPCAENVYVPNVFSPNGDKINDTWRVLGNHLDRVFIVVYDRWGEEVFRTEDPHQAWDGTFNGEFLKPDVFAYAITVYCIDGERLFLKGNLTLVR
ncbi:MAG: gliding motility-associated C-terminal domain-containing protein, partial [Saprospiraceae bacterium]|nr:gliding motility-associated C-terminal domain-containing protein [Saprospiraceae bacterium]